MRKKELFNSLLKKIEPNKKRKYKNEKNPHLMRLSQTETLHK